VGFHLLKGFEVEKPGCHWTVYRKVFFNSIVFLWFFCEAPCEGAVENPVGGLEFEMLHLLAKLRIEEEINEEPAYQVERLLKVFPTCISSAIPCNRLPALP